ncbi:tRNA (pseudouridine(54)-N(1))-methyltransferase [uncultured archaeon]|nr:tRNA (pseudouridine(54)-N(1))-methyltransferase [uncultured archaeon]
MRHFVYFSRHAQTSGNFDVHDLMRAGRMDIAIHSLIAGLFLSHDFRKDAIFHLVFYGQPDPPKHIEIQIKDETVISKKDVANLIKKVLYKYREGEKHEVFPGISVEKKSVMKLIEELEKEGNEIFILDKKGESLRKVKIPEDCAFVLGDQDGIPLKELKRLKKLMTPVSIGPKTYFASQTVAIVNNELDVRGI